MARAETKRRAPEQLPSQNLMRRLLGHVEGLTREAPPVPMQLSGDSVFLVGRMSSAYSLSEVNPMIVTLFSVDPHDIPQGVKGVATIRKPAEIRSRMDVTRFHFFVHEVSSPHFHPDVLRTVKKIEKTENGPLPETIAEAEELVPALIAAERHAFTAAFAELYRRENFPEEVNRHERIFIPPFLTGQDATVPDLENLESNIQNAVGRSLFD